MARFYWVFDGFVEPEHYPHYVGPENALLPTPIREELRAHLEPAPQPPKDEGAQPAPKPAPQAPNLR